MLRVLKNHPHIISFCLVISFFGGLGQTYLIAQFIPSIEEDLGLSKSAVSGAYSLATFFSSFGLSWVGQQLDRRSLRGFLFVVLLTLAVGFALLGMANELLLLGLGFFLVRFSGQMTLGMTASTIVGKTFGHHRGKALTLVAFGRSLAEGVFPLVVTLSIGLWGWRLSLGSLGISAFLILIPLSFYLARFIPRTPLYSEVPGESLKSHSKTDNSGDSSESAHWGEDWNWSKVLREQRPFVFMLTNAYLPFALTGLFFQQGAIAQMKDWPMAVLAQGFVSFSACNIVANVIFGNFVDKFGARNLLPIIALPLLLGLFSLMLFRGEWASFVYLGFLGVAMGASIIIKNSFWAEVYGLRSLGKLKGMDSSVVVFATSLAPFLYGWLLDRGVAMEQVIYSLIILGFFAFASYSALSWQHRRESVERVAES